MSKKIDQEEYFELKNKKVDNKDLLNFFSNILVHWYWLTLSVVLCTFLAFTYLRYSIPQYKINGKLLVSDDKKGGMLAESALGDLSGLMGTKSSVDNEVEVLKTSDLMREMVLSGQAYIDYFLIGSVRDLPVYEAPFKVELLSSPDSVKEKLRFKVDFLESGGAQLSGHDTTMLLKLGDSFVLPEIGMLRITQSIPEINQEQVFGFTIAPLRDVVDEYNAALNVEVTNKNVSTIDLTLNTPVPHRGEELLSILIDKYVERNLHDKNVVADSTLSFINARLEKVTNELAGVEDKISGYKQTEELADISEQSRILLESSADYTKSVAQIESQMESLDAVLSYLQDATKIRVVPSAVIPQDATFSTIVTRYNEMALERERLLLANTEENPLVKNITGQIASLREDMIANVGSARHQLMLAKENQDRLSADLTAQIRRVPRIERGYIDLARLQQIKQEQYIFLQEKWEETAISRTANVSNSRIIDSPKAQKYPYSPKRSIIMLVGLIVGLAVPLTFLYIKELFNVRVQNIDDIEKSNSLPVLGMISHSSIKSDIVVDKSSRSPIAEQFRAMRTNLEFALNGGKRILFTSSMSGEGKSYVALNLAISLALLDKKVLLMELDLRKPSITSKLGLPAKKGFSHYVVRPEMKLEDIIGASNTNENVDIIQAGAIPPNPAELLVNPRTKVMMDELALRYDYIIMDAPPVGMVTDAQLLNRYADLCLFVVRQGYTYKEQLRIPNDLVSKNKISGIQLVVNDVQTKGNLYSGYGYGYGYGNYGQEPERRKWWQIFKRS